MKRLLLAVAVGSCAPWVAQAQDFERVAPKLPPAPPKPSIDVPEEAAPPEAQGQTLMHHLRGVVFVRGIEGLRPDGVPDAEVPDGVLARDLPELSTPEFTASVRPFLGRPITQGDLDAIGRLVREAYVRADKPFVYVSVPPQKVSNGIVQLVVTQYRVGDVSVTGNRHFSTGLVRRFGDLKSGETLTLPRLRKALDDYNQNPFLSVDAVLKPGAETGLTDVELQARDRRPWRVYGGYDNQGVPTLDRDEWYLGFNWGNVLGTGQTLSYQYTRSFNGRYQSHSASDVVPLDADNRLLFFGAYAIQKPFVAAFFDSKGHSGQASMRWSSDLPSIGKLKHTLQVGVDFKRTNNNLEFAGFRILDTSVGIFQFPVSYSASMPDALGETVIENLFVVSPGNVTKNNDDASFRMLVPGSDATYVYDRVSLTRTTRLPAEMTWIVRAMVQLSNVNLPYSEQLGAGGIGSVRGYDTNTALGSQGILLSQEIRTPAFSVLDGVTGAGRDQLQFGVFLDYAYLEQRKAIPDLPRSTQLGSIGAGAHYTYDRNLNIDLELGWQLRRAPGARGRGALGAVTITLGL